MKRFIQKTLIERWWVWLFLLFFLIVFQLGEEKPGDVLQGNTNKQPIESINIATEETVDSSEFKQIRTGEELKEILSKIPPRAQVVEVPSVKEEEQELKNDEKKTAQQKQLQRKWDLKNGVILSEEITLDLFTKSVTDYISSKEQGSISEKKPIIHESSASIYYEYAIKEDLVIRATARSEDKLLTNITAQVNDLTHTFDVFSMITSIISPELSKEEQRSFIEKMENGSIHKFQTKKSVVYQWSTLEENGVLTVMKQKE